jgi:biopolymer transport protein ExbD
MRGKKGRGAGSGEDDGGIAMTPMIDIVFQMIIFFVCTADMDRKAFDEKIRLALSPHGPQVEKKDPRTITIEVDAKGQMKIMRRPMAYGTVKKILRKAVAEYGQTTPVVIRGDANTKHEDIKNVMDLCAAAGLWKVKFAATKEQAQLAK